MSALEKVVLERIRSNGPIPFASYMGDCLYHPDHGYYRGNVPRTGWQGHFVTSPELDPAFGELWGEGIRQLWENTGRPDEFDIVEIGPGEGGFAKAILSSLPEQLAAAVRYRLVERSKDAQKRQRALLAGHRNVTWSASLNEVPTVELGVVFANELLDNLPVHVVEQHGGRIQEVYVDEKGGTLVPHLGDPSSPDVHSFLSRHGVGLKNGARFEVSLAAEGFVRQVTELVRWGAVVFVDYGAEVDELLDRPEGTLVCYSDAGADSNPLERPGEKDLTVHANWTVVRKAMQDRGAQTIGPVGQRDILIKLGLADMDARFRKQHGEAMVSGKGADAVRALSRRQALAAMADPGGLGGLQVMIGLKEVAPPAFVRTQM